LVYFFFYINIWGQLHNWLFSQYSENFISWDLDSNIGLFYVLLTFLNIDNLFMFFYILFLDFGFSKIVNNPYEDLLLLLGNQWLTYYTTYKLQDSNFSFFAAIVDYFILYLCNFDFYSISSYLGSMDYNNTPLFFYFGSLFFFTVILSWFFFSYLGLYGIFKLNIITLGLFWVSLLLTAKSVLLSNKIYIIKLCSWVFLSSNVKIDYYFLIDSISFSFILLTTTIAFFVFIYAFSYFRYEPLVDRFLLFILSFVISMLFLVASGNTIMLFLGWELIGLTSFFLINFWTTKAATLKSAFKAFSFNKISDFFMFMFLVSTYSTFYTFDILSLNQQIYKYEYSSMYFFGTPINVIEFIAAMILGAAFIKSAQLGGHAWLPDSMEAPVPASSLIHSATLVSAGVYLILRFNFIFDCTQYGKFIIPLVGSLTAAYGGVCAAAQSDIKKTLAYSTISHCGFLMVLCSTEMNEFTILYLYVHGFFKAGVFMCVGNVLRITRGYQDTRRMGGLLKYLPFEYFCATVGLLNLAGLPFTFGFFIKHLLLLSLDSHIYLYGFIVFNSLVGAFSGLFYSFRIINYTFADFKKGNKILYLNSNRINYNSKLYTNSSLAATLSIFFLFIFSYIITYFMFFHFLYSNFLFSDYVNTTILSNYYSTTSVFSGYLLNFSYINITVVTIFLALLFNRYKKVKRFYNLLYSLSVLTILFLFIFVFYNLI
jgi:NADH:ubiquinone oxidoreductase subunit 5 (subunit L)/multisubunit Na+/H+ antiporter MnhA subunit